MATTKEEKMAYEKLRKSFITYERYHKIYRDENLEQIISLSRKIGCKQIIRYASMTEEERFGLIDCDIAKDVHAKLTNFVCDYYNINLLLYTIYGSLRFLAVLNAQHDINKLVRGIDICISTYLDYDGIHDDDIDEIISSFKKIGTLKCLTMLSANTSSKIIELKKLFYKVEERYLPILDVIQALVPFLAASPIAEIV